MLGQQHFPGIYLLIYSCFLCLSIIDIIVVNISDV